MTVYVIVKLASKYDIQLVSQQSLAYPWVIGYCIALRELAIQRKQIRNRLETEDTTEPL